MLLNELENFQIYLLSLPKNSDSPVRNMHSISGFKPGNIAFLKTQFPPNSGRSSLYEALSGFLFRKKRFEQESLIFPVVNMLNVLVLQDLIEELKPDIIWAEHLESLLLAGHLKNFEGKLIYSHHDFLWKLILIRRKRLKDFFQSFLFHKIQKRAVQQFGQYVVGGASNEMQEIKEINPNSATLYLPTLYPSVLFPENSNLHFPLRIVHLGSPKATANHIGIKNLFHKVIPKLQNNIDFECHLIGTVNNCDQQQHQVLNDFNVIYEGFVPNLKSTLRPFDIHILPYDKATGSRTRYAVAMNHAQVLIAHEAAVEGIENLVHNENCIIANSFDGIVEAIIQLYHNPAERIRIGRNAKIWHDETHQVQANAAILKQWLLTKNIYHD